MEGDIVGVSSHKGMIEWLIAGAGELHYLIKLRK
jgi:hypothetical protein